MEEARRARRHAEAGLDGSVAVAVGHAAAVAAEPAFPGSEDEGQRVAHPADQQPSLGCPGRHAQCAHRQHREVHAPLLRASVCESEHPAVGVSECGDHLRLAGDSRWQALDGCLRGLISAWMSAQAIGHCDDPAAVGPRTAQPTSGPRSPAEAPRRSPPLQTRAAVSSSRPFPQSHPRP